MAKQTWQLTNIGVASGDLTISPTQISDEPVKATLLGNNVDVAYVTDLIMRSAGRGTSAHIATTLRVESLADGTGSARGLSLAWTSNGAFTIEVGNNIFKYSVSGRDNRPPYQYNLFNALGDRTRFLAFIGNISNGDSGTLTLDDGAPLSDAVAPTPVIDPVAIGDESTTVRLTATVPTSTDAKPYDTITYKWKVSGGTLDDATLASPTWTRPAVSANTNYNIDLEITVAGTDVNAENSTSDTAVAATIVATVRNILPDADAPTVVINAIASGQEETTVTLSATLTGGTYDDLDYQWSTDEGALDNATSATPRWTRPAVTADTTIGVNLVITVRGTGTRAKSGTSDSETATEVNAAVTDAPVVLSVADAPTIVINAVAAGIEGTTVRLSASEVGGIYDTLVYAWTVDSGTLDDATLASPTWTRPTINTASATVGINLEVTAQGNGIAARSDTSDTATAAEVDATVTDTPLPVADAPDITINAVPSGREGTTIRLSAVVPTSSAGKPYDTATFRWTVSGGTLNNRNARSPTWTRPQVNANTNYNIDLRVTFRGTDTNARNGTSDIANATRVMATVTDTPIVIPNASAPTVVINTVPPGLEETMVQLSAAIDGGVYDTIAYRWMVSGGTLDNATAVTPTWTRPRVSIDGNYNISLTITVQGTGTNARNGTSGMATAATRPAQVTNTPPVPDLPDQPTPQGQPIIPRPEKNVQVIIGLTISDFADYRLNAVVLALAGEGYIDIGTRALHLEDWSTVLWEETIETLYPIKSISYKQRRLYLHPNLNVIATYAGTYDTFRTHSVPTAADSFDAELTIDNGFEIIDAIAMPGGLFIFTDVTVLQVPGDVILSADNFPLENLQLPGIHNTLGPLKTKDKLVYLDSTGRDVRAVVQQNEKAVYGSTDLTALTDLVDDPQGWCYAEDIVWVAQGRDLLSCTYYPEQNVLAWMKHSSLSGNFEDCAAVLDDVYFAIERNGEWYIERFADSIETNLESDEQYGTPEFTMLPFRTADAPGQGELELVLNEPVDIQGAYVQYLGNLGTLAAEISGTNSAVAFDEAEVHDTFKLASLPEGGLPAVNELDPTLQIKGSAVISGLQVIVDAEVNPLPITRG